MRPLRFPQGACPHLLLMPLRSGPHERTAKGNIHGRKGGRPYRLSGKCRTNTERLATLAFRVAKAPRCLARTRSGTECQSPAVKGKRRCRMHGGKGSGAPEGNRNAWKHGARSAKAQRAAALVRAMARLLKDEEANGLP